MSKGDEGEDASATVDARDGRPHVSSTRLRADATRARAAARAAAAAAAFVAFSSSRFCVSAFCATDASPEMFRVRGATVGARGGVEVGVFASVPAVPTVGNTLGSLRITVVPRRSEPLFRS